MKKILIFTFLFIVSFLIACSEDTSTSLTSSENVTSSELSSSTTTLNTSSSSSFSTTTEDITTSLTTSESNEILSCEVKGITGCEYSLEKAVIGGGFEKIATYQKLSEAQTIMNQNEEKDLVVRNSYNKILAMKYGAVNFKTKSISETTTLAHVGFPNATYLNGNYNVDGVYLYSKGIFVYGVIAGVRFEVIFTDVELIPDIHLNNPYSYYQVENNELVHYIAYNLKTSSFQTIGAIDLAPEYLESGVRYYSYDNHYFYTDFRTMTDDLRNNTYENAINKETPYYNYYQYLSFRSKSNYTAEELNSYISQNASSSSGLYNTGQDFINAQDSVFINAAMELAFAIHESGWGNSQIAKDKNNLFGINAYDSDPYNSATSFDTVQDCIEYHVQYFLGTRYFDPAYYVSYGTNFGNKYQGMNYKYASDAFWGEKIAKHYYRLDKALGFKDRNSTKIALLKVDAVGYYGANLESPIIYNPDDYTYQGLLIPFSLVKESGDFYALRLPIGLNEDLKMDAFEVLGPTDIFYVLKSDVIIVN